MITENDKRRAKEIAKELSLRGKECPECGSPAYYWLKSSGRCTDCGFHWGLDRNMAKGCCGETPCQWGAHPCERKTVKQ